MSLLLPTVLFAVATLLAIVSLALMARRYGAARWIALANALLATLALVVHIAAQVIVAPDPHWVTSIGFLGTGVFIAYLVAFVAMRARAVPKVFATLEIALFVVGIVLAAPSLL